MGRRGIVAVSVVALLAGCRRDEAGQDGSPRAVPATQPPIATAPAVVRVRPESVAPSVSCSTAGCHENMTKAAYVHGPVSVGGCDACHGEQQAGHKFPMKRPGDATCTLCHLVLTGKSFVHAAVQQGGCMTCHDPHGSSTKYLLTADSLLASCRKCHPDNESGKYRHGPFAAGACTVCHDPHEADNAKLTIRSGAEHCLRCHTDLRHRLGSARTRHPPAVDGCISCHRPHTAEFAGLLKEEPRAQCATCHAATDTLARTATSRHGAVFTGKECLNCHDVHASTEPRLLRMKMPDMCLTCHDKPQQAYDGRTIPEMKSKLTQSEFLHGPIRSGACQECHQVHGSSNSRLLSRYFSGEFYKGFDLANYALCFSCHDKALVLDQETTSLTGFRNGERNLHFVHVNRSDKGRTCVACHEIHGSNQPKHMAQSVPFEGGGWAMPLNFRKTDTGGGCAPGCHQPYDYDREKPVAYPGRP